jgi:hypothetical protein
LQLAALLWYNLHGLNCLHRPGLRVCIDFRDFDVGVPSLVNMERAVDSSRRTSKCTREE